MDPTTALVRQPTPVLTAMFRHIASPVDRSGVISPFALTILQILHGRGYPLKNLLH